MNKTSSKSKKLTTTKTAQTPPSRRMSKEKVHQFFQILAQTIKEPVTELNYCNEFELLIAVILSAQATDKSVNKATETLYKVADTPQKMLALGEDLLISYIRSIGLYRTKAKHVMELSRILIEEFDSKVPSNREDLMKLPGVGRKTANVVLNVVFHKPTMPVDTHLLRICPKIGIAEGKTPLEVEESLVKHIPQRYMEHAHHWLILHGRYTCKAQKPQCSKCLIYDLCEYEGKA